LSLPPCWIWPGFEWRVALRFLREGRMQTVLIIVGVAAGVAVIAYISALITACRPTPWPRRWAPRRTSAARAGRPGDAGRTAGVARAAVLTETQPRAQRLRSVANWQALVPLLEGLPAVAGVSPMVSGSGPGAARRGITGHCPDGRGAGPL
jgi:lipoprotein-releasing system permease protein